MTWQVFTDFVQGAAILVLVLKLRILNRGTVRAISGLTELIGEAFIAIDYLGRQLHATPEQRIELHLEAQQKFEALLERYKKFEALLEWYKARNARKH